MYRSRRSRDGKHSAGVSSGGEKLERKEEKVKQDNPNICVVKVDTLLHSVQHKNERTLLQIESNKSYLDVLYKLLKTNIQIN